MKQNNTEVYYTPIQLKMPVDLERIIEVTDPVYTFNEVMDHIDLNRYFVGRRLHEAGRPPYDRVTMLKLVLFAFMEYGYVSLRWLEKLCKTDIRFMWLLDDGKVPTYATFCNFINNELQKNIETIFRDINQYIFAQEHVDQQHMYLDGTKIEANANKYTWVWKKSCITNRNKVFEKLTKAIEWLNTTTLANLGVKFGTREVYEIAYVEDLMRQFLKLACLRKEAFSHGSGHRKSLEQRQYETLESSWRKLRKYAMHIEICGEKRNSYSKTDPDATFMRMKRDYMGNDQLLPAYNVQVAVCDEYVAAVTVEQYASDMDCFTPLMEQYHRLYGFYPQYPVGDAGYGSFNNYLFYKEHGMELFMKFPTYEKERKDKNYRDDPYRAVNFAIDGDGDMVCPNGKKFRLLKTQPVKGNQYGRVEELYQCEGYEGCPHREKCHKSKHDRIVRLNRELTQFHAEVLANLNCIHGALLRMNRSIQAEGAFGTFKWNHGYKRARRRGLNSLVLKLTMISCGFNLHKYDLKRQAKRRSPMETAA